MIYKLTILKILLLFSCSIYSQSNTFSVHGRIDGLLNGTVEIWQPKSDSTLLTHEKEYIINDGLFNIEGHLEFPKTTLLIIKDRGNKEYQTNWFYIDQGEQELMLTVSNNEIELQSDSKVFLEFTNVFIPKIDSLKVVQKEIEQSIAEVESKNSINRQALDSLNHLRKIALAGRANFVFEYIVDNPKSYISLNELSNSIGRYENISIYETAFHFLDEDLKQSHKGKQILVKIENARILEVGNVFPSWELIDTKNEKVRLFESKQYEFTLIDFWFHNCGYCILQMPQLKKTYAKHHSDGFQIVGITVDRERNEANWKLAIMKNELPWLQLWDLNGVEAKKHFVNWYPTNYLLNKEGEILYKNIDLSRLDEFLEEHLR